MATLVSFLLVTFAWLLAIPVCLFCIEVFAALFLPQVERSSTESSSARRRIAVLVPAHNESSGMLDTLDDIKKQLQAGDRLLVVADNCTDDTAAVARTTGAEVIERHDLAKIGKGYALEWGIRQLRSDPPETVIMIDADCRISNAALSRLASLSTATKRPVQSLYLMSAPDISSIDFKVAVFAFRVKNWVRPLGLRALHLPCQLMGTGMAFPWAVISTADLETGAGVEDLKLGLELAEAGHPALFCPAAGVHSQFPSSTKGARSQRKRWEQGHIGMIGTAIPRLIYAGLAHGNYRLLALTLDMAVPPITLLGMLLGLMVLISGFGVAFGLSQISLFVSGISLLAYGSALFLCWIKFGTDILPISSIREATSYVFEKIPLYRQILGRRVNSQWVRTDRGKEDEKRPDSAGWE